MASADIPEDVRRLLEKHVEEYDQLEVLLLLHRERGALAPAEVGRRLRLPEQQVRDAVSHLREHGLLREDGAYGPQAPALAAAVDRLARVYEEDRVGLIQLMSANALERLRGSTLRTFAEAFRLRGPRKDG